MEDKSTYQNGKGAPMDPVRIKLIRNSRGYGWEISVGADNPEDAFEDIQEINAWMEDNYAKSGPNNSGLEAGSIPVS